MTRILHFEIVTDNPERTIEFYEKVFGWAITKRPHGDYKNIRTGDPDELGIDGGIGRRREPERVPVNSIYVEELDKHLELVKENGGEIIQSKRVLVGVGWLAYFKDTEGLSWA